MKHSTPSRRNVPLSHVACGLQAVRTPSSLWNVPSAQSSQVPSSVASAPFRYCPASHVAWRLAGSADAVFALERAVCAGFADADLGCVRAFQVRARACVQATPHGTGRQSKPRITPLPSAGRTQAMGAPSGSAQATQGTSQACTSHVPSQDFAGLPTSQKFQRPPRPTLLSPFTTV